jgi:hypothetical protein
MGPVRVHTRMHSSSISPPQCSLVSSDNHNTALPMKSVPALLGRLQGSILHRPSPSSYTSTVVEHSPTTTTHLPNAAHADASRAWCIGRSGSYRPSEPARVSASHEDIAARLPSMPPKTAKRPSLITHPPPKRRATHVLGKSINCQEAPFGDPGSGGANTFTVCRVL